MEDLIDNTKIETLHNFSDGTYTRTINVKENTLIIGHYHITDHTCILVQGELLLKIDNTIKKITAPCIFEAKANTMKIGLALTDVVFCNVFPANTTNIEELEEKLIDKKMTNKLIAGNLNIKDLLTYKDNK